MTGGKLQILIRGNQDIPLIGNPQITFFKQLYRKHTNFSMDSLQQSVSGEPKFNSNYKIKFEPYGELLSNIYCHVNLPELNISRDNDNLKYLSWVDGIGYNIFDKIQLKIGEQIIDTQNGEWLFLNDQLHGKLSNNNNSELYYNQVVHDNEYKNNNKSFRNSGNIKTLTGAIQSNNMFKDKYKYTSSKINSNINSSTRCYTETDKECYSNNNNQVSFITNFRFWFCKYLGCAIPMIAIPNLDVTLNIKNKAIKNLINTNSGETDFLSTTYLDSTTKCDFTYSYYDNFKFYGEYIFLDNDEKRRFSQNNHKYLIEQIQSQNNINFILNKGNYISLEKIKKPFNNTPYKYNQLKVRLDFTNPVKYFAWVPHINNNLFNNISLNSSEFSNQSVKSDENTNSDYPCGPIDNTCRCTIQDTVYNNNDLNYSVIRPNKEIHNISNNAEIFLFDKAQLFMENVQRTPNLPAKFFANIFQKRYFSNVSTANYIYVYSFSINPKDHQPSGTCNFSKLNNVNLALNDLNLFHGYNYTKSFMNIYACSYNILTIQSGNCYIEYPI